MVETIQEVFQEKNYPSDFLALLENFIYEFDELFSKYVPKEELITRIKNNVDLFEWCKFKGSKNGEYVPNQKAIRLLPGMGEEETKKTIFHELLHSIVSDDLSSGIRRVYQSEDFPEDKFELRSRI